MTREERRAETRASIAAKCSEREHLGRHAGHARRRYEMLVRGDIVEVQTSRNQRRIGIVVDTGFRVYGMPAARLLVRSRVTDEWIPAVYFARSIVRRIHLDEALIACSSDPPPRQKDGKYSEAWRRAFRRRTEWAGSVTKES